jgi:hypothetical protein
MAPQAQTLFSIVLFLALSSLFAWKIRRHRGPHADADGMTEARVEKIDPRD